MQYNSDKEQLYHVICTDDLDNSVYVIISVIHNKINWGIQRPHYNGLSFSIFKCKRLIETAKQEDNELIVNNDVYTYKIIPAKD